MTRLLIRFSLLSSCIFISLSANADIKNGKELHDSNCTSCHISMQGGDGSGIYTREHKRIESYPALIKQVKRCRDSLGVPWPEEHVNDVVEYLNSTFYKYKK
ncbi:MAG: cytochrome c [Gammaproteobacteria bacterium]|nr:cytochrome c [Gammaproteobacteria bacterium]